VKRIRQRIFVASHDLLATAGIPTSPADLANFQSRTSQSGGKAVTSLACER
jgi:hypothetical protein